MIARVASFEGLDVAETQRTMADAELVIRPLIKGLAGYAGHLELLSPRGKVLSITLFETDEDLEAAEPTFDEEMPRSLGALFEGFEGRRVAVDRYNVVSRSTR